MQKKIIGNRPKIHERNINLATYPHGDNEIVVEGTLIDKRKIKIFDIMGNIKEPGIIHHMEIRLLIKGNPLRIVQAEAEMHHVPMDACRSTLDTLEKILGIEVKSGFSNRLREIIGGKNGCTHLTHLLTIMGQEIVHGWLTHKRQDKSSVPENMNDFIGSQYILNSCMMWAKNGPRWEGLSKRLHCKCSDD